MHMQSSLESHIEAVRAAGEALPNRPRVYFEEWDDPMISGIGWVSEIIDIAGGIDVFADLATQSLAQGRIVADHTEVIRREPDIMLASWCGKKFQPAVVEARDGWPGMAALRTGQVHELDASIILQPGPAALTDGLDAVHRIVEQWGHPSQAQNRG